MIVCPEGNENWSGGSRVDQQWRLQRARAAASRCLLHLEEDADSRRNGQGRLSNREPAGLPAQREQGDRQQQPQPAVSSASGADHPEPDPARCVPGMHPAHQPVVPLLDELQHGLCHLRHKEHVPASGMRDGNESLVTEKQNRRELFRPTKGGPDVPSAPRCPETDTPAGRVHSESPCRRTT